MIKETRYCSTCGSTIIQGENDGCNQPRYHTCLVCGNTRHSPMPKTFPKRLRVKEREFAILFLAHHHNFYCTIEEVDAIKSSLCVDSTKKEKTTIIDWDALEKEMAECNEKKKAWDKAWDRVYEIWGICSKNEKEFWEWHNKKYPSTNANHLTKEVEKK